MVVNHLVHSIIRRRTAKFSTAQQLQKEAHVIFQQRHENAFQQHFVHSVKYLYTPKQLHILYKKCAIWLLQASGKIYQAHNQYPSNIESSSDGINTYELPSLGYKITDRHLPRGFVTSRKSDTSDFVYCDQRSDVSWHAGMVIIVIACNVVNSNALYAWNTFRVRLRKTSITSMTKVSDLSMKIVKT